MGGAAGQGRAGPGFADDRAYLGGRLGDFDDLVLSSYRRWICLAVLSELPAALAVAAAAWLCIQQEAPGWLPFFALPWAMAAPRAAFAVLAMCEDSPHRIMTTVRPTTSRRMRAELRLRYFSVKGAGHLHVFYSLCGVWLQPLALLVYALLPGPWARPQGEPVSLHVATHLNTVLALAWTALCVHRDWLVVQHGVVLPREASLRRWRISRGSL